LGVLIHPVADTVEVAADRTPSEIFLDLFSHVQAQKIFPITFGENGYKVWITNHTVLQLIAAALAFVIFYMVAKLARQSDKPKGLLHNMFESVVLYVRDEMVGSFMPKKYADKLMPLFLTFFVFILFCNLLGLVPIPGIAGTATSNIAVTAALAVITLFTMIGGGMIAVGPGKFWTSLVPHGIPKFVLPIMFVIEVLGLFIKAFALTIRLFANMVAGHLVILSFFGLVYLFALESHAVGYSVMVPAVLMSVFITLLEVLVGFIQAYVFTFLSILFISMCVHPEH
jgi:F-type H+-transporting ATPase subunit a